ncbi:MBL fold metallo-hydrolase [Chakrabartyella piscis]|uniref:MBL fold metallo-hydrolase n=1 Tax=Chakrabartyella piscis TaxID=2918914 RepID=UPI002958B0E4|nr:MBL fold metallo-hydrolase [Chakrabartyella piscis]
MKTTYYHHSGFAVETETKVLLFDYYTEHGTHAYFDPTAYGDKDVVCFVSHVHSDHFDRVITDWKNVSYVVSSDVKLGQHCTGESIAVVAGASYDFHDMHIETLQSNDEGVAFLVEVDGKTIYHSGDLNWWHWNGEPDDFNDDIARSFTTETNKLIGKEIDIAFVPVDPRLEDKFDWAVDYFMKQVGAKHVFPMHLWNKMDVCNRLKDKAYGEQVAIITHPNQEFEL